MQLKEKHPLQGSTPSLTTSSTHTHKTGKNFTYGFVLGSLQYSSLQAKTQHLTSKTVILPVLAFKKNLPHLHSNQPKLSPVSESSTHPPQNYIIMLFPAHLQARELCPQTYSLSLSLEWSCVTHIPATIKSCRAYKPEKSAFYSTSARQLCDDTHLQ